MSQNYIFFTEIKHKDQWVCINFSAPKMQPIEHTVLIPTYEYHSRTLFQNTYDRLCEDGVFLKEDDLPEKLKDKIYDHIRDYSYGMVCIDYDRIRSYLSQRKTEHCAFALRSEVQAFECGAENDIYDYVTAAQYKEMDDELKKAYQYYEWNAYDGVFRHYKEIYEAVEQQLTYWGDLNGAENGAEVRVWMFIY